MAEVWRLDLEPTKKLVLLAYADHADEDGDRVYPSVSRVAHKCGLSIRQVQRISHDLRDEDQLMQMIEEGGGRGKPNRYCLTLENGVKLSPFKPRERVTSVAVKGDIAMSPEPSLEPSVSRRDAEAFPEVMKNPFTFFCHLAKVLDVIITPEDRKNTAKHFKDLKRLQKPNRRELTQVVSKMLEARTSGYDMSPQKALDKVRNGNVVHLKPNGTAPQKTYRELN